MLLFSLLLRSLATAWDFVGAPLAGIGSVPLEDMEMQRCGMHELRALGASPWLHPPQIPAATTHRAPLPSPAVSQVQGCCPKARAWGELSSPSLS